MEKFRSKSKKLFYVFVALEKAFDWVPQKVIWYALRKKGVPEYLDHSIVSLCSVCNNWGLPKISVKPIAICTGRRDVRSGFLLKFYADDLILCGEFVEEVMEKYAKWKAAVDWKGLTVKVGKTKGMQLLESKRSASAKIDPCGVCRERVSGNPVKCLQCLKWFHHCCVAFYMPN